MEGLTKEQYAEILGALERSSWYLKCAVEKLEKFLPPLPATSVKTEFCPDCKQEPVPRNQMYCKKCEEDRKLA